MKKARSGYSHKMPIPDDWNGEWKCYSIHWPNSIKWKGILNGILTQQMLGRFWDETTGNIKNTQVIGKEIFFRNDPVVECEQTALSFLNWILSCLGLELVSELPDTCEDVNQIFGSEVCCANEESDEVAGVLNVECRDDGYLWIEKCCPGNWVRVCYVGSVIGNNPPETGGITQDYKCNFAGSFSRAIASDYYGQSLLWGANLTMYASSAVTDQALVTTLKEKFASAGLNTVELFQAVKYYRIDAETSHSEIDDFMAQGEDVIRCILYNAIKNQPENETVYAVSPTEIALMISAVVSSPLLSTNVSQAVYHLLRAVNFSYYQSTLGTYLELAFDCTCGSGEALSPQSAFHGVDEWYLSSGIAGGLRMSGGNDIWPVVQWCVDNLGGTAGYGIAFKVISTSSPGLVHFNNPTFPQACESDQDLRPDSGHAGTVLYQGQYIVCDADVYSILGDDATPYILLENATYGDAPGEGIWPSLNTGKISMRSTVDHTPFTAYITDFRIIYCNADA